MSISYSALTNYGKSTLPSVDSWGINNNILRDPPKSITTRKIDKVGQTSSITEMIDEAGDRACEAINLYARGLNPSVAVSYSNYGNNGGQNAISYANRAQAYLPYTVGKDGAFRPPITPQFDLLPLSRMPRVWTSTAAKPGFADFTKKLKVCGTAETTKEVKTTTLKTNVRPTAVYVIETPLSQPYEIKNTIQNPILTSASAGVRTIDNTQKVNLTPSKEIDNNNIHAFAYSNKADSKTYKNNSRLNTSRYVNEDQIHAFAHSNKADSSKHVNNTHFDTSRYVNDDTLLIEANAPYSGVEKNTLHQNNLDLKKNLPDYQMVTNKGQNIQKNIMHETTREYDRKTPLTKIDNFNPIARSSSDQNSRDFRLNQKISYGGFFNQAQKPMLNRMQDGSIINMNSHAKSSIAQNVQSQFKQRYQSFN